MVSPEVALGLAERSLQVCSGVRKTQSLYRMAMLPSALMVAHPSRAISSASCTKPNSPVIESQCAPHIFLGLSHMQTSAVFDWREGAAILYYTILYYILYYTILYYTILYYTILYCTILYYTILYYTILYYTILYYTILYYTILYYTILSPSRELHANLPSMHGHGGLEPQRSSTEPRRSSGRPLPSCPQSTVWGTSKVHRGPFEGAPPNKLTDGPFMLEAGL